MKNIVKIIGNITNIVLTLIFIAIVIFALAACVTGVIYLWKNFMGWETVFFSIIVITGALGITFLQILTIMFIIRILLKYGVIGTKIILNSLFDGGIKNEEGRENN